MIAGDITTDCSNPMFNGVEEIGYIMNKSEIASFTQTGNVISALTLASGKHAYKIYNPGKTPFTGTNKSMVEGAVSNKFTKTVNFVVPAIGPDVCANIIDVLANGEFVIVLASKYNNASGNAKYEVFGWNKGMKASAQDNDLYSEETDGGWAVTMVEENVPNSGIYFFTTDEATTKAALEALC